MRNGGGRRRLSLQALRAAALALLVALVCLTGCGGGRTPSDSGLRGAGARALAPVLVPVPRRTTWQAAPFRPNTATDIVCTTDPGPVGRQAAARVREVLSEAGCPAAAVRFGARFARGANHVVLRPPTAAESAACPELARPESYLLTAAPYRVNLVSATPRGLFCAAQTLAQLSDGAQLAGCSIADWPVLPLRALHFTVNPDMYRDERIYPALIEAAARLKFNTVIIQFQSTVELQRHPEAVRSSGVVSQATVRAWVAQARACGLEVFPEIKSWGHADWTWGLGNVFYDHDTAPDFPLYSPMFALPAGLDGQNSFRPGPQALRLLTDTYDEMIEVFGRPRYLHIGGDEAWAFGYQQGQAVGDPIVDGLGWLRQLAGFLRARNVRMICAGDMFLDETRWLDSVGPGCNSRADLPTARILRHLPRDIVINDWHYRVKPDYPSLQYFHSQGFDTLASVYGLYGHENITNFDRRAAMSGALGTVQTTWKLLHTETAFIPYGAEAAWSGGQHTEAELGIDFEAQGRALLDGLLYPNWQADCLDFRGGRPIYPPFTAGAPARGSEEWGG